MAQTFFLNFPQFARFKNWCKITSWKKSSLTLALVLASLGVKLLFLSKKCIFQAEKGIFSKSSFYTKMFRVPKYSFSVCQKKLFVIQSKVNIFHQIQPSHGSDGSPRHMSVPRVIVSSGQGKCQSGPHPSDINCCKTKSFCKPCPVSDVRCFGHQTKIKTLLYACRF